MLTARRQMDIAYPKQCVLYIPLRHGDTEASLRAIFIGNQETASLDNVAVETAGNHISHNRLLRRVR